MHVSGEDSADGEGEEAEQMVRSGSGTCWRNRSSIACGLLRGRDTASGQKSVIRASQECKVLMDNM